MARGYLYVLALALFVGVALGKNLPKYPQKAAEADIKAHTPFNPYASIGMTREEFGRTKGMGKERYARHQVLMRTYKKLVAEKYNHQLTEDDLEGDLLDDIVLTNEQLQFEIHRLQNKRQKRKIINLSDPTNPYISWPSPDSTPIYFMFDTNITVPDRENIKGAVNIWNSETCLQLVEVISDPGVHYLLITAYDTGCWSYIGYYTYYQPQPLNLPPNCLSDLSLGTALHEYGHALGLFHEQSRRDRDDFVTIHLENVAEGYEHNFRMAAANEISTLDVPYDMSSDMHYVSKAFSISSDVYTITPNNDLYSYNLGQYIGLTYYDLKIFNKAFCSSVCSSDPGCLREGYPDPNDCSKCKCPDGFGGDLCDSVLPSQPVCNAPAGGVISVDSDQPTCFEVRDYSAFTACNYHLQATTGRVQVWFEESFGALCSSSYNLCYHWVEVAFTLNLNKRGPRFCCYNLPSFSDTCDIMSEGNEVMVTLRSDYMWSEPMTGFKMCYKQVNTGDACFDHIS